MQAIKIPLAIVPVSDPTVGLGLILLFGIGAQWLAWRMRLPSILLLLFTGIIVGPVNHWIDPDSLLRDLLLPAVSLSVGLILFEGGLGLRKADLQGAGSVVRNLVTLGAGLTWFISSAAAHWVVGLGWPISILLGAVLIVTGPTVIGPLLRHIRPIGKVGPILRWEGTVIDPIGALLAVLVFHAIEAGGGIRGAAPAAAIGVLKTVGIGSGVGLAAAFVLVFVLRRFWVPDYLQNPVSLMVVIAAFVASNVLQPDSGLFTAVVMGIVLANQRDVQIRHIVEFKENLSVLLVSSLFIVLAARLRWENLQQVSGGALALRSLAFLLIIIFVARPLCVWISSLGSGLTWRERVFVGWMGPRGIVAASVASVFALRLPKAQFPNADLLVSLTFLVIIGTVIVYALTAALLARRLGLARPGAAGFLIAGAGPFARAVGKVVHEHGLEVLLVDTNRDNIRRARDEGTPTYLASVLSERVFQRIGLTGIGRLLALTPSDEVNALAAMQYSRAFGRSEVYQLTPAGQPGSRSESVATDLRGRLLFDPPESGQQFLQRVVAGATPRAIRLTEGFGYTEFRALFQQKAIVLFIQEPTGALTVMTGDAHPAIRPGQTLLCLMDADAPPMPAVELGESGIVETAATAEVAENNAVIAD
jgi:NhaP-type Na+/H+ or K+/H+ antiporter